MLVNVTFKGFDLSLLISSDEDGNIVETVYPISTPKIIATEVKRQPAAVRVAIADAIKDAAEERAPRRYVPIGTPAHFQPAYL